MEKINQIYKCEICGNLIELLEVGVGQLVCCGQPMTLLQEKDQDTGKEKHVPVVENIGENRIRVKVGEIPHPMAEEHYIKWIEIITDDRVLRKSLKPGDKPEKEFTIKESDFYVRIYCNIHGLWRN